jgi:hypothetical protein
MISEAEAVEGLRQVGLVEGQTHAVRAYNEASPHLILAGLIWIVGYVAMGVRPPAQWGLVWLPLMAIGLVGSFVLALRARRSNLPKAVAPMAAVASVKYAARVLWSIGTIMIFMVVTYLLFRPTTLLPYIVFPAFLLAFVYALVGSLGATRFVWIGWSVFAVTEAGLLFAPDLMAYFVAAGGGGGLLIGGLWLRRA